MSVAHSPGGDLSSLTITGAWHDTLARFLPLIEYIIVYLDYWNPILGLYY